MTTLIQIALGIGLFVMVGRMFYISRVREEVSSLRFNIARIKSLKVEASELEKCQGFLRQAEETIMLGAYESSRRLARSGNQLAISLMKS